MKASLLLLFVLFHCAFASDDINWDECGKGNIAFCRASNCDFTSAVGQTLAAPMFLKEKCIGFHIKPDSTQKWTISMMNQDQKEDPKEVTWSVDSKEIFKCNGNTATLGKDVGTKLSCYNIAAPPMDYPLCKFTVVSNGEDKISDILSGIHETYEETKLFSVKVIDKVKDVKEVKEAGVLVDYSVVDQRTPCSENKLYSEKCEQDEDCVGPKHDDMTKWECPEGYEMMYSAKPGTKFKKAIIKCFAGQFLVEDPASKGPKDQKIPAHSVAKCARKNCSVCGPKDDFKSLYKKPTNFGECASLKCTNDTFMFMNTANGVRSTRSVVQCSVKTKTNATEDARWVVEDEDEVEIQSAECKQSVACEAMAQINPSCDGTDERCEKPHLNSSGGYECTNGNMHVTLNDTNVRIDPPKCEPSGDWNVTMHLVNSSSSILWKQENNFTIKCILAPEAKREAPAESSFPWVIIILLVILLIIVVAVAIGVFCFLKRKNKKKSATPTPSKTSSSTSTSKKPSSSEQEPLTSAMTSATGDEVKTAIPAEQKPAVVLAKADLRGTTAAASDRPVDEKKEEKKGEPVSVKKEEKTSIGWPSEDTSKKQDIKDATSTKETLAPMPKSAEELKSQTGGDGESQVSQGKKNGESAKLLPKGVPRKYSKSGSKPAANKKDDALLNLTDSEDEPSQTGSKKKKNKRK